MKTIRETIIKIAVRVDRGTASLFTGCFSSVKMCCPLQNHVSPPAQNKWPVGTVFTFDCSSGRRQTCPAFPLASPGDRKAVALAEAGAGDPRFCPPSSLWSEGGLEMGRDLPV